MLELWTVDVDSGQASRLYESPCCIGDWKAPEWSPDGQYIAFGVGVNGDPADSGMAIIRADGTDFRWVSVYPMEADWQPIPLPSPAD